MYREFKHTAAVKISPLHKGQRQRNYFCHSTINKVFNDRALSTNTTLQYKVTIHLNKGHDSEQ